jgi:hypothetical protein
METRFSQPCGNKNHQSESGQNAEEGTGTPESQSMGKAGGHPKYLALAGAMVPVLRLYIQSRGCRRVLAVPLSRTIVRKPFANLFVRHATAQLSIYVLTDVPR